MSMKWSISHWDAGKLPIIIFWSPVVYDEPTCCCEFGVFKVGHSRRPPSDCPISDAFALLRVAQSAAQNAVEVMFDDMTRSTASQNG